MFDAQPEAFGSYRVLDEMRPGRFGRVFRAQEPATGAFVVVKVFEVGLAPREAASVVGALERLCRAPLDHASIVAPIAAGLEGGLPWLAEPQIDGESLEAALRRGEAQADALLRITQLAGALDFAAAAGIRHGALTPREIIVSGDRALIAGLGVQEALAEAGLDAPMRDDVQLLAAIAGEWLAGVRSDRVRRVLETAASGAHTGTALDFAAALQNAMEEEAQPAIREPEPPRFVDVPVTHEVHATADLPLRHEPRITESGPRAAGIEPQIANHGSRTADHASPIADRGLRIADSGLRIADHPERNADGGPRISESRWLPMTATLAIGLLSGFAAGFVVGQRDATPAPYAAERAVRRPAPRADAPAPTAGRGDAVPGGATEVAEPEVRLPPEPATANPQPRTPSQQTGTGNPEPGTRNPEPGTRNPEPATLVVESRPRGARVFVDGRLVGQTPLSLPGVASGEHAVRIDLIGYRRWVTRVNLTAGERTRVAASLER